MTNWQDKEQLYCKNCGHHWILISDEPITDEQHNEWITETIKEHKEICKYG